MKYIRTKDGKIWSFSNPNNNFLYEGSDKKNGKWLHEIGEIVKEADSLDALTDRTLLHGIDIIFLNQDHTKYRFENEEDNWYDITDVEIRMGIYGGIWTPQGIIYATRLDENREFKLL